MAQAIQYLTFGVDERFAVPVEQVQEILDLRAISRIPHAPDYVVGLMDVRGVGMLPPLMLRSPQPRSSASI